MALVVKDRVKETTTTTGTGTISLGGAPTGFQTFVAGIGTTNTTYYAIVDNTTGDYEVGIGAVTDGSPDTLSRDTILESSNSGSAINLQSGTKDVFCTQPAEKAVYEDASGNVDVSGTVTADGLTVDTDTLHVDAANNRVGIGTTSPDGLLSFPATASNTPKIRLQSASTDVDVSISSYADANGTYAAFGANHYLNSGGNDAAFDATKRSAYVFVDGRNLGGVVFGTAASGTATERMRIDSSGNLGVNNSSPSSYYGDYKLVVGNHSANDPDKQTSITIASEAGTTGYLFFSDGTSGAQQYQGQVRYNHSVDRMEFVINSSATTAADLSIDSSGRVGIGIVDQTQKLQVNGAVKVTSNFAGETSANTGYFDHYQGKTRITSKGADASTLGSFSVLQQASDGNPAIESLIIDSNSDVALSNTLTTGNTSAREHIEVKSSQWPEIRFTSPNDVQGIRFGMVHVDSSGYGLSEGDGYVYNANTNSMMFIIPKDGSSLKRQTAVNATPHTIWDSGNDGSGSGLDADTVDGIQGASFLRSDANDNATGLITLNGAISSGSAAKLQVNGFQRTGPIMIAVGDTNTSSFNNTNEIWLKNSGGQLYVDTGANTFSGRVLTVNDEGSGNGLDADTVDGIQGASFLRSDTADTATGLITFENEIKINNGNGTATHFNYLDGSTNYIRGTLLRIDADVTDFNKDTTDVLNFTANSTNDSRGISFNSRTALSADYNDGYLRLNQNSEFTNGVYTPGSFRASNNITAGDRVIAGGTSPTNAGQISLTGNSGISTSPYMSFHEGSTRRAYIQYSISPNEVRYYNEEGTYHGFYNNTTAIGLKLHTSGSTLRGYVYANNSNQIGFLDSDGNWAVRVTRDTDVDFLVNNVEKFSIGASSTTSANDITVNSDERIKDNVELIPNALEKVQAIRGVTFNRTDTDDDTRHAGVIAQEVEKVLPEVVTENEETGIKSVAYANMVGLLIEAVKEQQTQIDDLKAEVMRLKGFE